MIPGVLDEALIVCLTCGFSPEGGRGLVVSDEDQKWNEHGHPDSAHLPNWVLESKEWELADVRDLEAGDVLGTGETVQQVFHVTEPIETWSDTEDGQTSVITDQRTGKVGWPGESRIVRRVR